MHVIKVALRLLLILALVWVIIVLGTMFLYSAAMFNIWMVGLFR